MFFTSEVLKWHPEVVETCSKFPKCELNIYLAIAKRYNTIGFVEKKLWKIKKKGVENFMNFMNMLNDYSDNSRHNMTKNLQNSKFYFFKSDLKTDKKHL